MSDVKPMIDTIKFFAKAAIADRKGVTALEYGVIAAAIIAVTIALFNTMGGKLSTALSGVNTAIK